MRNEYKQLQDAIDATQAARGYISQNRGYDQKLAIEGYEAMLADVLVPAIGPAIDVLLVDVEPAWVLAFAKHIMKKVVVR